jgi:hypothetical protein
MSARQYTLEQNTAVNSKRPLADLLTCIWLTAYPSYSALPYTPIIPICLSTLFAYLQISPIFPIRLDTLLTYMYLPYTPASSGGAGDQVEPGNIGWTAANILGEIQETEKRRN